MLRKYGFFESNEENLEKGIDMKDHFSFHIIAWGNLSVKEKSFEKMVMKLPKSKMPFSLTFIFRYGIIFKADACHCFS